MSEINSLFSLFESLDVVVLLLHDDASNLRLCKSLHAIDRAFPELRAHEPSPLHLLARLNEPSYEGVYHEHLYREIPISVHPFRLILVGAPAGPPPLTPLHLPPIVPFWF